MFKCYQNSEYFMGRTVIEYEKLFSEIKLRSPSSYLVFLFLFCHVMMSLGVYNCFSQLFLTPKQVECMFTSPMSKPFGIHCLIWILFGKTSTLKLYIGSLARHHSIAKWMSNASMFIIMSTCKDHMAYQVDKLLCIWLQNSTLLGCRWLYCPQHKYRSYTIVTYNVLHTHIHK